MKYIEKESTISLLNELEELIRSESSLYSWDLAKHEEKKTAIKEEIVKRTSR